MDYAIVLMGVSGSGKTTIGKRLAELTGWSFFDGDDFHPPKNVAKMASGQPLDDNDRTPWLESLNALIAEYLSHGKPLILACSALKKAYRDLISKGMYSQVVFVYLKGDYELIQQRMKNRGDHFMKPEMLRSQFRTLEEPDQAVVIEISQPVDLIVREICIKLELLC